MKPSLHLRGLPRIAIAAALALLTVLPPLCAPLCAATVCHSGHSPANYGQDDCHHASVSNHTAYSAMAAPQLCSLRELSAATLMDLRTLHQRHASSIPFLDSRTSPNATTRQQNDSSQQLWPDSSPIFNDKFALTRILRI
jgi:hypothetical protein